MTSEITTTSPTRMWEKQPTETRKQYAAFCIYRDLPLYGDDDEKRTLDVVAKRLGYAAPSGIRMWSAKNNWVERANAYDQYMGSRAISAREAGIEEFQQATITSLSGQLLIMNKLIDQKLQDTLRYMNDNTDPDKSVDVGVLKKLTETIKLKDDLARRLSQLPTNFVTETVEQPKDEETVYIIGGGN